MSVIGAIIGDIVGSRFEFNNYRKKDFEFFSDDCYFTDDTVMTLAVAKAINETEDIELLKKEATTIMQKIGRQYPNCGYGGRFYNWMFSDKPYPYNSFGNGSAMRVAFCGEIASTLEQAKRLSYEVTRVTHNHYEGIKGAEATAVCIFLAKTGKSKKEIGEYVKQHYYDLDFTIDEIRPTYKFNETCQQTVPQAIQAFLESESFEDAIRIAVSVGGDSDTLAAITGSIAGSYYGVSEEFEDLAMSYLDDNLQDIYISLYESGSALNKDNIFNKPYVKKLPYRFTCDMPCEVVGYREVTKKEEEEFKKNKEIIDKEFNLDKIEFDENFDNED